MPATLERVREWLASADDDPKHAYRWWASTGSVYLPVGRSWNIVRTSVPLGVRVARRVPGPVIMDPAQDQALFMVGLSDTASASWPDAVEYVREGYAAIPSPHLVTAPGLHWYRPPVAGQLVGFAALHRALAEVSG
ncbi:hypothetical protein [Streptomyces daliensis]|uniref:Uncharacterized protein n=1 Tax=Streptomyces daliensis TaxID=299421 RepID=A0A8T4IT88_9ACTN|nr:hypothetical protein [Streptomyces daliensis]